MYVDRIPCSALLDSGCSHTIVSARLCKTWSRKNVKVTTIGGETQACCGVGTVEIHTDSGVSAEMSVLVTQNDLLGFDLLLGYDAIKALGGVTIAQTGDVHFLEAPVCAAVHIDRPDFKVDYDHHQRAWTASWKWTAGRAPTELKNGVAEYPIPDEARNEYEQELEAWIRDGWLIPYPEDKLGAPKGLIPLMAVVQHNKSKVRPVLDYRELNKHIEAYTADADVCASKLREWRQKGSNVSVLDLRKAYLQVRVDKTLWPFQTVWFRGQRYCLTRLGFGLNVAPQIMKTIVNAVLSQEKAIKDATSAYIDDVYVNEDIESASCVRDKLAHFGLECKSPERLQSGARVLGLDVCEEEGTLRWRRGSEIPGIPDIITRRTVFSLCGKLVGHLPVCGWLRASVGVIKRRVNLVTAGWDDVTDDALLTLMVAETLERINKEDPARGKWCVDGEDVNVWVDASALALGVSLEQRGNVFEDACWLRPMSDAQHINLAELDAVVKGINLALQWQLKKLHLHTDSLCVYHWVSDTLTGRTRIRTKAASEMLIRRRLDMLKSLVSEYGLSVSVTLVASHCNRADQLTRVPHKWYEAVKRGVEPTVRSCTVAIGAISPCQIKDIHAQSGHPGIKRTLYFARRVDPAVTRADVRQVVKDCEACQSIDPAPEQWQKGRLDVKDIWQRVAMDITHYSGKPFLTLIDCGPTRFAVWRQMTRQDSANVVRQLSSVFYERGAPEEILTDNDAAFCSQQVRQLLEEWGVRLRLRCAHVPSGNGIVERSHRSIKRIAARKQCTITEATYWYNITPKDGESPATAPANAIHTYRVRVKGIDVTQPVDEGAHNRYAMGDPVWVRPPGNRCTTKFKRGRISGVISQQSVLVDGTPRHVRDLRPATEAHHATTEESDESSSDELLMNGIIEPPPPESDGCGSPDDAESEPQPEPQLEPEIMNVPLRRSKRNKRPTPQCTLCDHEIRGECGERTGNTSTAHHVGEMSTNNNNSP